jgi:hypothetical protein
MQHLTRMIGTVDKIFVEMRYLTLFPSKRATCTHFSKTGLGSNCSFRVKGFIFLALIGCLLLTGCVTGKRYDHLRKPTVGVAEFESEFNKPVYIKKYSTPTRISETTEYRRKDAADYIHIKERSRKAALLCVYRHNGPFYDESGGQVSGMIIGMTFGLGLPYAIWLETDDHLKNKGVPHYLSVWFTDKGKYIDCAETDVSMTTTSNNLH